MKRKYYQTSLFIFTIFSVIVLTLISIKFSTIKKLIFWNRANTNELTIEIELQGNFDRSINPSYKTKLDVYNQSGLIKEYTDLELIKKDQNIFKLTFDTSELSSSHLYAFFIKPDKYLGRLFCSPSSYSADCTVPQITIQSGSNTLNLTQAIFFSGDISSQNGKVDAEDISKIISQVGQESTSYIATDINSDFRVQTLDYSLALYSLSQNYVDDVPSFTNPTNTPTPTTPSSNPTDAPTPTTIITSTPTPTSPPANGPGTCRATINANIYINSILGEECYAVRDEKAHECVDSPAECLANTCADSVIVEAKAALNKCSGIFGGLASLNEQKTRETINCVVEFVPGECIPSPTPEIDCNAEGEPC